jgi:hypothetical protein
MERNEIRDGAVGQDRPAFRFAACGLYVLSLPFDLKMNVVVVTRRPAALEADERRRHPQARCKVGLGEDALQPEILPFRYQPVPSRACAGARADAFFSDDSKLKGPR